MSRTRQITTENLKSLRLMTFCGEPLLENHLDQIFEARPDIHVQNTYGPTEATVSMTEVVLEATNYQAFCDGSVTLGAPIEGMRILLEDGPSSDEGEVVIAGPQVADGYWGDPDRTSQVFVRRTIDGVCQPAYRTGDWAQFINGQLYFRSRIDRQVKRNGHRIELGDIDVALRKGGAINAASLMLRGKIISFVEVPPGSEPTVLFNAAKIMLPGYRSRWIRRAAVFLRAMKTVSENFSFNDGPDGPTAADRDGLVLTGLATPRKDEELFRLLAPALPTGIDLVHFRLARDIVTRYLYPHLRPDLSPEISVDDPTDASAMLKSPFRGQGIGRAMIERCIWTSRNHDAKRLTLKVAESARAARAFYRTAGFLEQESDGEYVFCSLSLT